MGVLTERGTLMSKKAHAIVAICFFVIAPVWLFGMLFLYDHLATLYQRPNHPLVNVTGLAALFGTSIILVAGIINAVKAKRE